jgi:hypothetical protein
MGAQVTHTVITMMDKRASNFFFKRFMMVFHSIVRSFPTRTCFVEADSLHPPLCCSISGVFSYVNIHFFIFHLFSDDSPPGLEAYEVLSSCGGASRLTTKEEAGNRALIQGAMKGCIRLARCPKVSSGGQTD